MGAAQNNQDSHYERGTGGEQVTEELIDSVKPAVIQGERTLPVHLALQMKVRDKRAIAQKVAPKIRSIVEPGGSREATRFAAETLNYLLPPANELKELARAIARRAIAQADSGPLLTILHCENPLIEVILEEIFVALGEIKSVASLRRLGSFLDAMHLFFRDAANSRFLFLADGQFIHKIYGKQRVSPFVTKLVFDITGQPNWAKVGEYGLRLWSDYGGPDKRHDFRLVDSIKMVQQTLRNLSSAGEVKENRYADLAFHVRDKAIAQAGKIKFQRSGPLYVNRLKKLSPWDPQNWRDDLGLVETAAFSVVFHLEALESFPSDFMTEDAPRLLVDLTEAARDLGSRHVTFFEAWTEGRVSFFSTERANLDRARLFRQG